MTEAWTMRDEMERVRRVADSLCTGHAALRDRYASRALILDVSILGTSTWLVALSFVDPQLSDWLTPLDWDSRIWIGVLGVVTFFATIFQLKTDWKARADGHKRTLEVYAEVKREAGYILAAGEFDDDACKRVLARYDLASAVGLAIPEKEFLRQKQRHKLKVALSKHLDTHPSASLLLTRIRFWIKDNFESRGKNGSQS
ncbi:conserved hypothetical protein [uncultured Defluviicoccus sp.]|uniref:SMODS and SLOG-associating 2TM effector domain-containing protein n=1 Tax=metagenome TaxID=256318 RepID=A0A380T7D6_9ZZZZ|nr:conserved hypothetical protein [uncultured Defluviicoccus sp.]